MSVAGNLSVSGFTATDGSTITTGDNTAQLTLISTDADANDGPLLVLNRNSSSPSDNDKVGQIQFLGEDDASNSTIFGSIVNQIKDASNGSEDGRMSFNLISAGSDRTFLNLTHNGTQAEVVVNEDSRDMDFRVESDASTNALFVEGSSGNVGIGTDSPSEQINLVGSGGTSKIRFDGDSSNLQNNFIGITGYDDLVIAADEANNASASTIQFRVDATERMRISGGNLLVGKTSAGIANTGSEFSSTGRAFFTFDGGGPLQLNRKTSDGDIIELHKDGTEVGSIGAKSDDLYIGTGILGFRFNDGNDGIWPIGSSGANRDAAIDLGNSGVRFRDAYLSGNVIISGSGKGINFAEPTSQSGSVSQILDAYEEGTWVPSTNYGTISNNCWYIKIGNSVTVGGNIWSPTNTSSNYPFAINSLPFSAKSGKSSTGAIIGASISGGSNGYSVYISGGTSQLFFYESPSSSGYHVLTHADLTSSSDIHFAITYYSS